MKCLRGHLKNEFTPILVAVVKLFLVNGAMGYNLN